MQTLIDKNDALRKEISELKSKVKELQNTPLPKRANKQKTKKKRSMFGTLMKTTTQALNLNFYDVDPEMSPKQAEAINEVHRMILEEKYDEVDVFIQEKKKVIFGKVKKGATPNPFDLKDEFGETVLMKAIKDGKNKLVMTLIDKGATVNLADNEGETALMVAAKYGELAIVKSILKNANRDAKTKFTKKTALHFAAEHGHYEVVMELLGGGVDPLIEDVDGKTALAVARGKQVKDEIRKVMNVQLAAAGGEKIPEEDEAETANDDDDLLHSKQRSYSKDEEMKPFFEENLQLEKEKQRLELRYDDLQKRRAPKDTLLKLNALNAADRKKVLGLKDGPMNDLVKKFHNLVLRGNEQSALDEVESMLTEKRKNMQVDKNATDQFGETALMKASRLGYDEMVGFLLLYKCDIEKKDVDGYTALMKAAQFGKRDCCLKLIGEGADIDATSRTGKLTALMLAAQRGHGEICQMLIVEGANHQMINSQGLKAVDLASNDEAKTTIEKAMEENPVHEEPIKI